MFLKYVITNELLFNRLSLVKLGIDEHHTTTKSSAISKARSGGYSILFSHITISD